GGGGEGGRGGGGRRYREIRGGSGVPPALFDTADHVPRRTMLRACHRGAVLARARCSAAALQHRRNGRVRCDRGEGTRGVRTPWPGRARGACIPPEPPRR